MTGIATMTKAQKCTVREGRFVEPCKWLDEMTEVGVPPKDKRIRGIYEWLYTNMKTGKPSRSFFGVKSSARPNGIVFNFCPWCGEKISPPARSMKDSRERIPPEKTKNDDA